MRDYVAGTVSRRTALGLINRAQRVYANAVLGACRMGRVVRVRKVDARRAVRAETGRVAVAVSTSGEAFTLLLGPPGAVQALGRGDLPALKKEVAVA
jgi:hypothetical protein